MRHAPSGIAAAAAKRPPAACAAAEAGTRCFHCALPLPPGLDLRVRVGGRERPVCCPGCQAVAGAIEAAGLAGYYRHRTAPAAGAGEASDAEVYDHPALQRGFVRETPDGLREASLMLEGVTCAACVWLIEQRLRALPGMREAHVNFSTQRAGIRWDGSRLRLSEVLRAVAAIGYRARPYDPARREEVLARERRIQLRRIAVAGVLGMQVMMIAVTLYSGEWSGMEEAFRRFFRWVSLALTAPVVLYAAAPFFSGAWRDLRAGTTGMDVPVSLGIAIAFGGSAWATVTGAGHVYYDSVVMFVFLLLVARYLEFLARRRNASLTESLVQPLPAVATRLRGDATETLPAAALQPGDRVLVRPGETVPADGCIRAGRSRVDESLLSGESRPVPRRAGDAVAGGAVNLESPLEVEVQRTGPDTVLSHIVRLADRAQAARPRLAQLADRAAGVFTAAVLVLAGAAGLWWWHADPARWLPVVVSVLVVTCPCALSLATPAGLGAGCAALARRGLIVTRANALETLARAQHFVLDKTGTLTAGRPALVRSVPLSDLPAEECLARAAALAQRSEHPLSRALVRAAGTPLPPVREVESVPGAGLRGRVAGREYRLGSAAFTGARLEPGEAEGTGRSTVVLADARGPCCRFVLEDALRPGAAALVAGLRAQGRRVSLLSGDEEAQVRRVAAALGIDDAQARLGPADKLARIQAMRAAGEVVAAVGDGVNDAPVLAGAQVSVAMGEGTQLARASADMILMGGELPALLDGVRTARRTLSVIRQNLAWAALYNLLALPAAALGHVAPWMAALGMSLSSLVVVANALRVGR